jgi:hypothetical protein
MKQQTEIGKISQDLAQACNQHLLAGAEPRDIADALLSCIVSIARNAGVTQPKLRTNVRIRLDELWDDYARTET